MQHNFLTIRKIKTNLYNKGYKGISRLNKPKLLNLLELSKAKLPALRNEAKQLKIKGYYKLNKKQLALTINKTDKNLLKTV